MNSIIFDLDGVLWNSGPQHERAFKETLAEMGSLDFRYEQVSGQRTDEAFVYILEQNGISSKSVDLAKLVERKRRLAAEYLWYAEYSEQVIELISEFSDRYKLGLASSASQKTVGIFLERTGLDSKFQVVLSGSDVRSGKPSPEIYLSAAKSLGEKPENCLVIEDSHSGVKAACRSPSYSWVSGMSSKSSP